MIYPVKYLNSEMRGAPVINGTAGCLLDMLDACLGTGFGLSTLLSIDVKGGIATATVASGGSFDECAVVLIDGATPESLNGEARVLTTTSTGFTFAAEGVPDGAASGTMTAKYAPVHNWSKIYTTTNVAVWKSVDPQANGHYLRIDDSNLTWARVRGYESMTDADTGTGAFPSDAQLTANLNLCWTRSSSSTTTKVGWQLFGDSRFFVLSIAPGTSSSASNSAAPARGFGDPIALMPSGDAWSTTLAGTFQGSTIYALECGSLNSSYASILSAGNGAIVMPRSWQGLGSSVLIDPLPESCGGTNKTSGDDAYMGPFPSSIDGGLRLARMFLKQQGTNPPRAIVPGVYYVPQSGVISYIAPGTVQIGGAGELAGRRLVAVGDVNSTSLYAPNGIYFVDATGPWR